MSDGLNLFRIHFYLEMKSLKVHVNTSDEMELLEGQCLLEKQREKPQ